MIRRYILMLMTTAALSAAHHAAYAASLSESMAQALSSHPAIDASAASAAAADKTVWEQRSGFFPTISVNSSASRTHANNDTTRSIAGGGAYSWVGSGNVVLTQPLFAGFSTLNSYGASKARLSSARHELGGTSEDVALRAARAHLNLMRTKELLERADKYYTGIRDRYNNIENMLKEGLADESERLQAEEILISAKSTRLGYEEAWHQAEADYIEAVGTIPDGTLVTGGEEWQDLVPDSMEASLTQALANNPRVRAADRFVEALGKEASATAGEMLPRLNAEMSYTERDQREALGGESTDASAILRLTWNFSAGGAEIARAKRSLDQRAGAQARLRTAERDIEHSVRQKFTSMKIVDEQVELLTAREKDMQQILDNFLSQYEAGRQSNLQLISAHARLFDASGARVDATYRRLLARFELLNAMGTLRHAFGLSGEKMAAAALPAAVPAPAPQPAQETEAVIWGREEGEKFPSMDLGGMDAEMLAPSATEVIWDELTIEEPETAPAVGNGATWQGMDKAGWLKQ